MTMETRLVEAADREGVQVVQVSPGHWHVRGKLLVNYYPQSKSRTAYVQGMNISRKGCTPEQAVKMSMSVPDQVPKDAQDKRKSSYSRVKRRMLARSPYCHWCHIKLDEKTATLDHVIPLSRGGMDNASNWVLACSPCNAKRGNAMPEVQAKAATTINEMWEEQRRLEHECIVLLDEAETRTSQASQVSSVEARVLRDAAARKLVLYRQKKVELKQVNMKVSALETRLYQSLFSEVAKQRLPEQLFVEIRAECAKRYDKLLGLVAPDPAIDCKEMQDGEELHAGAGNEVGGQFEDDHGSGIPE